MEVRPNGAAPGSTANQPPFALRGVVEGFYGTFYTFPQRNDLIRFLGRRGFNYYMYGPKNDRQHRMRWFEPYPPSILDEFAHTIALAAEVGVTFCYAISFGVPIRYASSRDFGVVVRKLDAFRARGCRSFAVFFDDLTNAFAGEENLNAFASAAEAQGTFCNRLFDWLRSRDPASALFVCPTDYCGSPPFSDYVVELGALLQEEIGLLYTGPEVCSPTISTGDVRAFAQAVRRAPVIWDNYPVNDAGMRGEMHVGPLRGRDPRLGGSVRGLLSNPMNECEASKIALHTVADYLNDPAGYHPVASWREALRAVGGEDASEPLARFAENSLKSALHREQAPRMDRLVGAVLDSIRRGEPVRASPEARALSRYFDTIDQSGYRLKNRMHNLALRQDLLPWIEALEARIWMGRAALAVLAAIEEGDDLAAIRRVLDERIDEVDANTHLIGGNRLRELAGFALERAVQVEAAADGRAASSGAPGLVGRGVGTARAEPPATAPGSA